MKNAYLLLAFLGVGIMSGCDHQPAAPDAEIFYQEKTAWEAQDIKNYRFTVRALLDTASRPVVITVNDGVGTIEGEWPLDVLFGKTISGIYSRIEDVFKKTKGSYAEKGYTLKSRTRYNEEYHYPELIWWGPCYKDEVLDGGGMGIEISAFEIL
jgi:hypothetical protein